MQKTTKGRGNPPIILVSLPAYFLGAAFIRKIIAHTDLRALEFPVIVAPAGEEETVIFGAFPDDAFITRAVGGVVDLNPRQSAADKFRD